MAGKTPGRAERMGGSAKHFSKNPRGPVKTMPYKLRRRSSFGAGHAGPVGAQAAMASRIPTGAWKSYIRGGAGEKIDVDGGEEDGA
ncbi:hypothetical protein A0H81_05155 [Grifola frondosa]|uniref:Uncharacterized protein n=1 Tax=Grifola frondosa TaxID=5627 RepID=A0A1C7MC77_GRIFR|nr:hypothetical protein A0H81_05155 [Grifola frondosa]